MEKVSLRIYNQYAHPFNTPAKHAGKEKLIIAYSASFKNFEAVNHRDATVELPCSKKEIF